MQLKTKIYLFYISLTVVLFSFLVFTYYSYENEYKKSIKEYVEENINIHKKEFLTSYNGALHRLKSKKRLFKIIHSEAITLLKENPNLDLNILSKRLIDKYDLINTSLDIFLINKEYTIYKTTFQKDLGFNLSIIYEAKQFLDKTTVDKKIYIADNVSIDALNMEYKIYSYSYLKDGIYLELGFIDKNIFNNFRNFMYNNENSSIKLYNITKTKDKYLYYPFSAKRVESKDKFYKTINKVSLQEKQYDDILNAYIKNRTIFKYDFDKVEVSTPLFENDMIREIGYNNIVLNMQIDISHKMEILQRYKMIFYISTFVVIVFLIFVFIFIENNFTKHINKIIISITSKKKVEDKVLLGKNDELSLISKEYNKLFDSLKNEVGVNQILLKENQRFIADTVHQIQTPLTNIMMNSEMIQKTQKDEITSMYTQQINASINMLTNSYEDLSYIISANTIEYTPSDISISDVLTQRIDFFKAISQVNFKNIVSSIESDINFYINQVELERLIDNNISNAIKYADTHKPITISLSKKDNTIVMQFKTYSKPIKNPIKIFEKNYREDNGKRGLGLGLNMVKNICKKYNISYNVIYKKSQNIFTYTFNI